MNKKFEKLIFSKITTNELFIEHTSGGVGSFSSRRRIPWSLPLVIEGAIYDKRLLRRLLTLIFLKRGHQAVGLRPKFYKFWVYPLNHPSGDPGVGLWARGSSRAPPRCAPRGALPPPRNPGGGASPDRWEYSRIFMGI